MATIALASPTRLSEAGRAAHDIGLAGLLGGSLYGRLALRPAATERGRAAWRRYGFINSLSLAAVLSGWFGSRLNGADHRRSAGERRLASLKDILLALAAVVGLATAVEGLRFARIAPEDELAAPDTDAEEPRAKRRITRLMTINLGCGVALVAVHAALALIPRLR